MRIFIEWRDDWLLGIPGVDREHQELAQLFNQVAKLYACADERGTPGHEEAGEKIIRLLNEMGELVRSHFRNEEALMRESGYPELEEHKQYHQELFVHARQVKRICEGTETSHRLDECFDAMARFLVDDILRGDIHFKSYLEYEGYLDR